jgi:hypothetical protein
MNLGEFPKHAVDIGFVVVLILHIFAVGELFRIAERIPIRDTQLHAVTVSFQPNIAVGVRAELERRLAHRVVQLVGNDFVFGRFATEVTQGGPGS